MWENRHRDHLASGSGISPEEQEPRGRGFGGNDVSDVENPYFQYTM